MQISSYHCPTHHFSTDSNLIFIKDSFSKIFITNHLCLSTLRAFSFHCGYEAKEATLQSKFLPVLPAEDDTIGIFSELLVIFFPLICSGLTIKDWNWFLSVVLGLHLII